MNDRELEGVVAHELGHVLHRDILTSSIAATLAAAITHWRTWRCGSAADAGTTTAKAVRGAGC